MGNASHILCCIAALAIVQFGLMSCRRDGTDGRRDSTGRPRSSSIDQPFYKLDSNRFLVLRPGNNGLNNQLQCLNLAANLAIEYNRTLLVQSNAYAGSHHAEEPIPFDELFDVPNLRLSILVVQNLPPTTMTVVDFDPELVVAKALEDPDPTVKYLAFACGYGELHHSLPESALHRDEVLLPFHPTYRRLAQRVIDTIRDKVKHNNNGDIRLLGMHVRRGDCKGYPVFVCSDTGYPQLNTFKQGGWWLAACGTDTTNIEQQLSWDRVLTHLQNCDEPGIPLCSKDYNAIFVATNDVEYVRRWGIDNLFLMDDFSFVREAFSGTKCHAIKEFVVEEMVMVLSTTFLPSAPSSITDMILHLRLNEHGRNEQDVRIYEAYDQLVLELKKKRKGNIINWEKIAEDVKAARLSHP